MSIYKTELALANGAEGGNLVARWKMWEKVENKNQRMGLLNQFEQKAFRDISLKFQAKRELTIRQESYLNSLLQRLLMAEGKRAEMLPQDIVVTTLKEFLDRGTGKVAFRVNNQNYVAKYTGGAGAYSRHPYCYYITLGVERETAVFLGRIETTGIFIPSKVCTPANISWIKQIEDDPQKAAVAYGHAMGICSFCARLLTDDRSIAVGYGPICAETYGLPWGTPEMQEVDI